MSLDPGTILILTGTPGSGKTTGARAIAAMEGCAKVHLHSDDFWRAIRSGAIAPWLPEADAQNATVMSVVAAAASRYAEGGFAVIVDGIIGPWFLPAFDGMGAHYVVLHPDLDEAISRCRRRGGDELRDPATITELHRQLTRPGPFFHHQLPVDGLDQAAMQRAIADAVRSGAFRLKV